MTKEFDIVVHGASGFTGRLVIEALLARPDSGLRWAMGGRSAAKLAAVRDEVGAPADTPLVVTDSADPASLAALMARTRLVLTTVGPYQLYGSALLQACAQAGVDYVDLCGEPAWMRQMIDWLTPDRLIMARRRQAVGMTGGWGSSWKICTIVPLVKAWTIAPVAGSTTTADSFTVLPVSRWISERN
jgi:saccharopine dehydrogenase-like NADP-dependent oxidoreductase